MDQDAKITAFKQFTKLIGTFSGRDKFNKVLQYSAKTLSHALDEDKVVDRLRNIDSGLSTARKADRLFWSLVDIQSIVETLNDPQKDQTLKVISVIGALGSAWHWYTDNVTFLSKIGVLDDVDINAMTITGAKGDFTGISVSLFLLYLKSKDEQDDKQLHLNKVKALGSLCDWILAVNDSGALDAMMGRSFNRGEYGIIGLCSALCTVYRVWNSNS
eukprot:90049_1